MSIVKNEYGSSKRDIKDIEVATIDTVNDLGRLISDRMNSNLNTTLGDGRSMRSNGEETVYTPIGISTKAVYQELGLSTTMGIPGEASWSSIDKDSADIHSGGLGLGEAEVFNPPYQLNPHDDVRSDGYYKNIGRVYNDKIRSNYPIVVFEPGRIKYDTSITDLFTGGGDPAASKMTDLINGVNRGALGQTTAIVKGVLRTTFSVLTAPAQVIGGMKKFAGFENDIKLYAEFVDEMFSIIAPMFGVQEPLGGGDVNGSESLLDDESNQAAMTGANSYMGLIKNLTYLNIHPDKSPGWDSYHKQFIPLMLHKDVSVTESISNSTESSPMASALNEKAKDADKLLKEGSEVGDNALDSFTRTMKAKFGKAISAVGSGENAVVLKGQARASMPDIWSDSSFQRSYNMSFKFHSNYGHDLAVLESTYVPYLLLLALAIPRTIGRRTYTSPFIIRTFCKGWFSCPLGIIDSLTVERGEPKNNWTVNGRPRTIKVTISIKDLHPVVSMSMAKGIFGNLFQQNDSFTSYLTILGGLSLSEQHNLKDRVGRFATQIKARVSKAVEGGPAGIVDRFFFNHSDNYAIKGINKMVKLGLINSDGSRY